MKLKRLVLMVGINLLIKKQITELCNEHFVSISDKLAKSIQPSDEAFSTAYIKPATAEFKFKFGPISVLQVRKVIKTTCK